MNSVKRMVEKRRRRLIFGHFLMCARFGVDEVRKSLDRISDPTEHENCHIRILDSQI